MNIISIIVIAIINTIINRIITIAITGSIWYHDDDDDDNNNDHVRVGLRHDAPVHRLVPRDGHGLIWINILPNKAKYEHASL